MAKASLRRRRWLVLLLSGGISLGLCEWTLRWVTPGGVIFVGTDKAENARYYGWALPPRASVPFVHPDTGRATWFRSNSRGWKDVEHTLEKPDGCFRIVFLGDSITYGMVPLDRLYTRRVEALLRAEGYPHVEVITLAIGAWGTDQELEALCREGLRYQPDLVVHQFCVNDVTDNLWPDETTSPESLSQLKPFRYEVRDDALVRTARTVHPRVPTVGQRVRDLMFASAIVKRLNALRHELLDMAAAAHQEAQRKATGAAPASPAEREAAWRNRWWAPFKPDPTSPFFPYREGDEPNEWRAAWRLLELLIVEMQRVCDAHGVRFVVFSEQGDEGGRQWNLQWGGSFQTDGQSDFIIREGRRYGVDYHRPLRNLEALCARHTIALIGPRRAYARYRCDPHPDDAGNEAMARDIVEALIRRGLIPPPAAQPADPL